MNFFSFVKNKIRKKSSISQFIHTHTRCSQKSALNINNSVCLLFLSLSSTYHTTHYIKDSYGEQHNKYVLFLIRSLLLLPCQFSLIDTSLLKTSADIRELHSTEWILELLYMRVRTYFFA
jgi:hypothetical protein